MSETQQKEENITPIVETPVIDVSEFEKLWEGNKNDVIHSGVKELDDFVFANKVMLGMKGK